MLADDGNGGTYQKDFTVTVNDVNDAPAISEIEDAEIRCAGNADSAVADFTVSDPDTSAEKLTVSGKSSDPKLLPQTGIVFEGSGAERSVTLTPVSGKSGTATVSVTVSDGELTAETAFTLTVTVLPAPVFDSISVSPAEEITIAAPGETLRCGTVRRAAGAGGVGKSLNTDLKDWQDWQDCGSACSYARNLHARKTRRDGRVRQKS